MKRSFISVTIPTVALLGLLTGCATPLVENPVPSYPSDGSSFAPIETTVEVALQSDVEASKNQIEAFLLTGQTVDSVEKLFVNSNPGLFVITASSNENNTFTVTGINQNTMEGYSAVGHGNYNLLQPIPTGS